MTPPPYYTHPHDVWSARAIRALLLGLASAFVCWVPFLGIAALPIGVAGMRLGDAGLRETQRNGLPRGHGYALAGMIFSSVGMFGAVVLQTIIIVAVAAA